MLALALLLTSAAASAETVTLPVDGAQHVMFCGKAYGPETVKVSCTNPAHVTPTHAELRALLRLKKLSGLDLKNKKVSDATLGEISALKRLQTLDLGGTTITDTGLKVLTRLKALRRLDLRNTSISDAGLAHLAGLKRLIGLELGGTKITDAGLGRVAGLKGLAYLGLGRTRISDRGVSHLLSLEALRELDLINTSVTTLGERRLKKANPLNKIKLRYTRTKVHVQLVSRQGVVTPLGNVEVLLEVWTSKPRAEPLLTRTFIARTSGKGVAVVKRTVGDRLPPGGHYLPVVIYGGISFSGARLKKLDPTKPIEIRVYEQTESRDDLSGVLFIGIDVRETVVLIDETLRLTNGGHEVIVAEKGIRIPLLLPAVDGRAWSGYLPTTSAGRHVAMQAIPPRGRLALEKGGVTYYGPVMPGGKQHIRLRYAIPISTERQDLALRAPFDFTRVVLVGRWNKRIAPRVIPSRPFRVRNVDRGEHVEREIILDALPKQGEDLVIQVDRLPYTLAVASIVATYGSLGLFTLFLLFVIAARRRA